MWWNLLQLDTCHISCCFFFFFVLHTTVLNCNKSMGDKSHTFIYYLTSRTSRIDFCLQRRMLMPSKCHLNHKFLSHSLPSLYGISFNSLARWFTLSISFLKVEQFRKFHIKFWVYTLTKYITYFSYLNRDCFGSILNYFLLSQEYV